MSRDSFWPSFLTSFQAGISWAELSWRLEEHWRGLPSSAVGSEAAAERWLCHQVWDTSGAPAPWIFAVKSGLWSPSEALQSALRLRPKNREDALAVCVRILPDETLREAAAELASVLPRDGAWPDLARRYFAMGEEELGCQALRRITWPDPRVEVLAEVAPKLTPRRLAEEVEAAWNLTVNASAPPRYFLVQSLAALIPWSDASVRKERAAFVEQWVRSLPETDWEVSQSSSDLRVLAAQAWAAAGDAARALEWADRLPEDEVFSRVSVLPALEEQDRLAFAERALAHWPPDYSSGLLEEVASACPMLADRCLEVASRLDDPDERRRTLLGLGSRIPLATLQGLVEETITAVERLDDPDDREVLLTPAWEAVADRSEPELQPGRERLRALYLAKPSVWLAHPMAAHLSGGDADGLWRWIVEQAAAANSPETRELVKAAVTLMAQGDEPSRDSRREEARALATGWLERLRWEPEVAASLLDWFPRAEQRDVALRLVRRERALVAIHQALLSELLTASWQEEGAAGISAAIRTLLVGSGRAVLVPLLDATSWGRAAVAARAGCTSDMAFWERALAAGRLEESDLRLLAEVRDMPSFVRWIEGEGRGFAEAAYRALTDSEQGGLRSSFPELFPEEGTDVAVPSSLPAPTLAELRECLERRGAASGIVKRMAANAAAEQLEQLESLLEPIRTFSMSESSEVWTAIAWRWQALGEPDRAQEAAGHSEFDQYRADLRFGLAKASRREDHLLAALREVGLLPYDPAISLFPALERCVEAGLIAPMYRLLSELERSRRVVARAILLGASDEALAAAGLTRSGLEAEVREETAAFVGAREHPREHCLSWAGLALPPEHLSVLWDLAYSFEARDEEEGIGFPASAARIAWRWRGVDGLEAMVEAALRVAE